MLCYVLYTSINWPGISTSVVTCIFTALTTVGASRQKQVLRFLGAVIGGFIFAMGAQIFLFPHIDYDLRFHHHLHRGHRYLGLDHDRQPATLLHGSADGAGVLPGPSAGLPLRDFAHHCPRPCRWHTRGPVRHVADLRPDVGQPRRCRDEEDLYRQPPSAGATRTRDRTRRSQGSGAPCVRPGPDHQRQLRPSEEPWRRRVV